MRVGALGSSPLTRRPLRMRWNEAWRVSLRGRWSGGGGDDQVTRVQGLEGASVKLLTTQFPGTLSGGGPQSLLWGGTTRPIDDIRSRSSGSCSGSPQACPGGLRILGWTRWERRSWGWDARWPCMWPPMSRSWNPSSTQLRLSWHWGSSMPARHNRGRKGQRWSGCPAWHPGF